MVQSRLRHFLIRAQGRQKGRCLRIESGLQAGCAIAVATGPWLGAVFITAVSSSVRVLNLHQVKILVPVRPLFLQRRAAKADFHPAGRAIGKDPGILHVADVLVASDGTGTERSTLNCLQQLLGFAGSQFSTNEISHRSIFFFHTTAGKCKQPS